MRLFRRLSVPLLLTALAVPVVAQQPSAPGRPLATATADLLALTVERGEVGNVRALLRLGADPSGRPRSGIPPLITALDRGRLDLAALLLRAGADPNAPGLDGRAPLVRAVQGVRWGEPHAREAVALLLAHGADPNLVHEGWTGLHTAVAAGDAELAAVLLAAGADPNARGADGRRPLELAAAFNEAEVAALLVRHGADRAEFVPAQRASSRSHPHPHPHRKKRRGHRH